MFKVHFHFKWDIEKVVENQLLQKLGKIKRNLEHDRSNKQDKNALQS